MQTMNLKDMKGMKTEMNRYGDYTDFILVLPGSNKAKLAVQIGAFFIGAIGGGLMAMGVDKLAHKCSSMKSGKSVLHSGEKNDDGYNDSEF